MYLLYLQVTGAKPQDAFEIVVPVTRGDAQRYYVGRRGVFFTLDGQELDAQIVQIVENPISLWESMKEPARKLGALIASRTEQLAASVQKEAETQLTKISGSVETSVQSSLRQAPQIASSARPPAETPPPTPTVVSPPTPGAPRSSGTARDLMIGAGFVVAGLGTALKFFTDTAAKLREEGAVQQLLLMATTTLGVFLGVIMAITAISAWIKLRKRDMGVLLQASGWAINGRLRVKMRMARLFVRPARLPEGAQRRRKDLVVELERLARRMQIKPPTRNFMRRT
jgi:hypothetical protein